MDDGSLTFGGPHGTQPLVRLHVEGFGELGCRLIRDWLERKFGLEAIARANKREKWTIYLSGQKKVKSFMEIVQPEIVEAMIRKSLDARLGLVRGASHS